MECVKVYEFVRNLHIDDLIEQHWKKSRVPIGGGFELTCNCNLSCVHCYAACKKGSPDLSTKEIFKIIDDIEKNGSLFIYLTGGEIFTRKDFSEIYMYLKHKGFLIEILSNGTMISEEIIDLFNNYPPVKLDISMYGYSREVYESITQVKGSYDKFLKGLNMLKESNIYFDLKTVVMIQNKHELFLMREFAKEYGAGFRYTFTIFPDIDRNNDVIEYMLTPEETIELESKDEGRVNVWSARSKLVNPYVKFEENRKQIPLFMCDIARYSFFIDYQGNLCGCNKNRKTCYSLLDYTFKEAWTKLADLKYVTATSKNKCKSCEHFTICEQCSAEFEIVTGDPEIPIPSRCMVTKIRASVYK